MSVTENLARVRERIALAAREAGVPQDAVTLVGVTKFTSLEAMHEAQRAGLTQFGENYPQHLAQKLPDFEGIAWHFIGHLQTNKVKSIVGRVHLIQSVDSVHLAEALERAAAARDTVQELLVQVNIGREPQKSGVLPEDLEALLTAAASCGHLRVRGLMAIPPQAALAEESRPYFAAMRGLFERWRGVDSRVDMAYLSMGMSMDYAEAIREGANMVRVGTAIFGARPAPRSK